MHKHTLKCTYTQTHINTKVYTPIKTYVYINTYTRMYTHTHIQMHTAYQKETKRRQRKSLVKRFSVARPLQARQSLCPAYQDTCCLLQHLFVRASGKRRAVTASLSVNLSNAQSSFTMNVAFFQTALPGLSTLHPPSCWSSAAHGRCPHAPDVRIPQDSPTSLCGSALVGSQGEERCFPGKGSNLGFHLENQVEWQACFLFSLSFNKQRCPLLRMSLVVPLHPSHTFVNSHFIKLSLNYSNLRTTCFLLGP